MDRAGLALFVSITLLFTAHVSADDDFDLLTKKGNAGDKVAQYKVGLMYSFGRGVEKDYNQALEWFRMAAEQDFDEAQYAIGRLYVFGQGVKRDYGEAVKWYQKAAEQDYAQAQYGLGMMYASGRGVEQDYADAYFWYSLSAANGHDAATSARNIFETLITPEEAAGVQERIKKLRELIPQKRKRELKKLIAEEQASAT